MKNFYLLLLLWITLCRAQDETIINNDSINETLGNELNSTVLSFNSTYNLT